MTLTLATWRCTCLFFHPRRIRGKFFPKQTAKNPASQPKQKQWGKTIEFWGKTTASKIRSIFVRVCVKRGKFFWPFLCRCRCCYCLGWVCVRVCGRLSAKNKRGKISEKRQLKSEQGKICVSHELRTISRGILRRTRDL